MGVVARPPQSQQQQQQQQQWLMLRTLPPPSPCPKSLSPLKVSPLRKFQTRLLSRRVLRRPLLPRRQSHPRRRRRVRTLARRPPLRLWRQRSPPPHLSNPAETTCSIYYIDIYLVCRLVQ